MLCDIHGFSVSRELALSIIPEVSVTWPFNNTRG